MKTNRSCIPPQHAGISWWWTENFCVHWLTMLIFCFTLSMIWYRNIQRRMTCTSFLFIPAYIKSVAWLYVFMYAHTYIDTYMHAPIYMLSIVTDFMSTLWYHLPFIIYITLQVSVRIIWCVFILWCWILNGLCHVLRFYHACWFYLNVSYVIICFVSNDEIKLFNQPINSWMDFF